MKNLNLHKNNYWATEQGKSLFNLDNPEYLFFHPKIAKLINDLSPKKLLDYGCGDGFISSLVAEDTSIDFYDINVELAKEACKNLDRNNCHYYEEASEIPSSKYDCILFSLVLICIDNLKEFQDILQTFKRCKTDEGKVIITIPHPCFRQYEYRVCYTEYSKDKEFNYNKQFDPFTINMKSAENPKETVKFTDFHWTLADTINEVLKQGFNLLSITEHTEEKIDEHSYNSNFPLFITLIFS